MYRKANMTTFTATKARAKLFDLLKGVNRTHQIFRISHKNGNAVLLSEDDYETLIETLELEETPGLLASIKKSRKEIEQGKSYSSDEIFGK
jgi:antitoxin YefM